MTIRRACASDRNQIAELWLRSRRASIPAIPSPVHSDDEVRSWFRDVVMPNRQQNETIKNEGCVTNVHDTPITVATGTTVSTPKEPPRSSPASPSTPTSSKPEPSPTGCAPAEPAAAARPPKPRWNNDHARCLPAPTDATELADPLRDLRDWIDLERDQLDPLLDQHGYDLTGLRVDLDRFSALLTRSSDSEPPF